MRHGSDSVLKRLRDLYKELFDSLCGLLARVNGAGERHEYIAALLLSLCMTINVGVASRVAEDRYGLRLLPSYETPLVLFAMSAFFAMHWVALIRGRNGEYFQGEIGSVRGVVAALAYIALSWLALLAIL